MNGAIEVPRWCRVITESNSRSIWQPLVDRFAKRSARKTYDGLMARQSKAQQILKEAFRELQHRSIGNTVLTGLDFTSRVYTSSFERMYASYDRVVITSSDFAGPLNESDFVKGGEFNLNIASDPIDGQIRVMDMPILGLILNPYYGGYPYTIHVLNQIVTECAMVYHRGLRLRETGRINSFPSQPDLTCALKFVSYKD